MENGSSIKERDTLFEVYPDTTGILEIPHGNFVPTVVAVCRVATPKDFDGIGKCFREAEGKLLRDGFVSVSKIDKGSISDCALEGPGDCVNLYLDKMSPRTGMGHYIIGVMSYPNSTREIFREIYDLGREYKVTEYLESEYKKRLEAASILNTKACVAAYAKALRMTTSLSAGASPKGVALAAPDQIYVLGGMCDLGNGSVVCSKNYGYLEKGNGRVVRVSGSRSDIQDMQVNCGVKKAFVSGSSDGKSMDVRAIDGKSWKTGDLMATDARFVSNVTSLRHFVCREGLSMARKQKTEKRSTV